MGKLLCKLGRHKHVRGGGGIYGWTCARTACRKFVWDSAPPHVVAHALALEFTDPEAASRYVEKANL